MNGANVDVSDNHTPPHMIVLTEVDLMLAGDIPFGLGAGGTPSHQHTTTLVDADKQTLIMTGGPVTLQTSTDQGHSHTLTLTCA